MEIEKNSFAGSGLLCLVAMARFHQMAADPAQVQHQFGRPDHAFSESCLWGSRFPEAGLAGANPRL